MTDKKSNLDAYLHSSATEQATAIANGSITSSALLAAQQGIIDQRNPQTNAFVKRIPATDQRHGDGKASSALSGISFAIKDNIDALGLASHCGLKALDAQPATADAPVVARLRDAGLILTGRLNMAPMAVGASTQNPDFGDCFNPLKEGFSAGGSSGGAASAVAAGMVSIALGTDTMGSVRLPAAYCGIVGFKPTWGHIPTAGVMPLSRALDHVGVLSRSVQDAQYAYALLAQKNNPNQALNQSASVKMAMPSDLNSLGLEEPVREAFEAAIKSLQGAGYSIATVDLSEYPFSRVRRAGLQLSEAELINQLRGVYPEKRAALSPMLASLMDFISERSAADLARALTLLMDAREWLERTFAPYDVIVLPTAAHLAFAMTQEEPADSADLTAIANVLGAPAISLPLAARSGHLPAGLQLIGRRQHDYSLLAIARELETILQA